MRTEMPVHKTITTTISKTRTAEKIWNSIAATVPPVYLDDGVKEFFAELILPKCSKISIEYPYIDTDYLSTYYLHYSKAFRDYRKECCRIILYGNGKGKPCAGYVTLRPLSKMHKVGKTYLDPTVFAGDSKYIICGNYKIHHEGVESNIPAMPYMKQEQHVAVCAHICLWSAIRFFSSRFANCSTHSLGEIVERIHSPAERKIPSRGLSLDQISTLLMDIGFSCIILRRDASVIEGSPLEEQLLAYIDSGIPVICVSNTLQHAVIACGRPTVPTERTIDADVTLIEEKFPVQDDGVALVLESFLTDGIIVNDDSELPYHEVTTYPSESFVSEGRFLKLSQIDYCIVPLESRMVLSYTAAKDIAQFLYLQKDSQGQYINRWRNDVPAEETKMQIMKLELVSSNTFKEWIRESLDVGDLPDEFMTLLEIAYPRFLWLAEFSSSAEYASNLCSGFIVLDASCVHGDPAACLILADNETCNICSCPDAEHEATMRKFRYSHKFQIPLFRKNYKEVHI